MIPLHRPWFDEQEEHAVRDVIRRGELAGNGPQGRAFETELAERLQAPHVLAVSSATHALEIAIHLAGAQGGEVIVPSFTFPSVGNAIARAGGRIRFCEIREPDLNVDLDHALSLVGPSTRALVVTHYAGHPLDCRSIPIPIVEDAAHALGSSVKGHACGTLAAFGCLSFHQTKNLVAGEGGALIVREDDAAAAARIFREKGTNRDDFLTGRAKFYSWVALGSSLVLPEISAAIARVQLRKLDQIVNERRRVAGIYDDGLSDLEQAGTLSVVRATDDGVTSHHIYAVLVDPDRRDQIIEQMRRAGVQAASHFVPLHASPFGKQIAGQQELPRTDRVAASLIRLPIYPGLSDADAGVVIDALRSAL